MRAIYSTHKQIRLFILGVPEGWQVAVFDLQKQEWTDRACSSYGTLMQAKRNALERAAAIFGKHLLHVQWH